MLFVSHLSGSSDCVAIELEAALEADKELNSWAGDPNGAAHQPADPQELRRPSHQPGAKQFQLFHVLNT